jgi:hypothetical protein
MYWVRSSYKRRILQLEYQVHEMKTLIQLLRKLPAKKNDCCVHLKNNTQINYMTEIQNSEYQAKASLLGEYFPDHRHTEVAGATNSVVVFTKPCTELKLFCESA